MDQANLAQFISITGAPTDTATQYLQLAEGNVEGAIEIYFANDGASLEQPVPASHAPPVPPPSTRPANSQPPSNTRRREVIDIDSDEDDQQEQIHDEESTSMAASNQRGPLGSLRTDGDLHTPPVADTPPLHSIDDDEAMARRLQEEMYGGGGGDPGPGNQQVSLLDEEGYRAPMQRTTETLVGPESFDASDPEEMRAAVMQQMMARRQARDRRDRPGIFNQAPDSIWNADGTAADDSRQALSRATGGASEASVKANTLAEMYRPPFELMSRLGWDQAREQGKENQKWILVNIQDPSIFDCQLLNRDIWKNDGIQETVRENFIFMQYSKDDAKGNQYTQYYFQNKDVESAYPHIAIVDPRTGEQVKKWSGPPAPKQADFLMQLHEFLDRYSLRKTAKNPVAKRKADVKQETQLDRMTEEQQMEMAMKASLAGASSAQKDDDPDDLTRSVGNLGASNRAKGKRPVGDTVDNSNDIAMSGVTDEPPPTNGDAAQPALPTSSPFTAISSTNPHTEPAPTDPGTTRIQFRHPNGRVVRRFSLTDPVRRVYEWLKAAPLAGSEGQDFELVSMQKNLIDSLDATIEQAGLKNGTVMVEIISNAEAD